MLVLPTITHIHTSVIPVLVGDGTIFLDGRAHKTIYDGAMYAAGHGATIVRFRHDDPDHLAELLGDTMYPYPRVIAMDGVNSMTGNAPDLHRFSELAAEHQALLYVDDAHGFGVIGERTAGRTLRLRLDGQQHLPPPRRSLRQRHPGRPASRSPTPRCSRSSRCRRRSRTR